MATLPTIVPTNQKVWENRHETFRQPLDNLYDVNNGESDSLLNDYNATTKAIQDFYTTCTKDNKTIRALGGGWSWTKIAATDGRMLNTKPMNFIFSITGQSISPAYTGKKDQLLFAQCGNSIKELHTYLNKKGRSLKTCGASNGQTIVGAISTGTHGSAIDVGATPDYIVGMHIILGSKKHIWLERKTYPVASQAFADKINAELVQDDDLFNAALVSFGSFGFIHGVMIESEPLFLLECFRQQMPLDDTLKNLMNTLDFTNAPLPFGSERPFQFQVLVNQYDLSNGVYVTAMYKRPYRTDYTPPVSDPDKVGPGDDAPAFLGKLTDALPALVPVLVNKLMKASYKPYANQWGMLGEIFSNTEVRGKVMSAAIGIPIEFTTRVNELLIKLNQQHGPFTGVFAYRYVKQTKATLGFTRFPFTCIVELDGFFSNKTLEFYDIVWDELEKAKIPFTFHWGKINTLDINRLKSMYGPALKEWLRARKRLLTPAAQKLFTNQLMIDWGLA
jgi:FAD/FMN-containing dehydrogenase